MTTAIDPGTILGISHAYWHACAIHSAVALGLFDAVGPDGASAAEIAATAKTHPDATSRLLDVLAATGLLEKTGPIYRLTPVAAGHLRTSEPGYIGHIIMHHKHLLDSWSRLDQAVRTGEPTRPRDSGTRSPAEREAFLMGMFNMAMSIAPGLAQDLDLGGARSLLDLGGGPGTYAVHFCQANPGLSATIFDLPTTRDFAERIIARFGLTGRVDFAGGDFLHDPIPGHYDVAWLSHILHGDGPDDCRAIVAKAAAALNPGGTLMVHEFLMDDAKDGPLFPALFSLNMLVGTAAGRSYSGAEIAEMLTGAGLADVRRLDFTGTNHTGIVAGRKAG